MNWKDIPKTELHIHLEGAAKPDFVRKKAHEKGLNLPLVLDGDEYQWLGFDGFLATYEEATKVLTSPEDYYDLTRAVLFELAQHNVKYTEITLGVVLMCNNDASLWQELLSEVERAADEAQGEIEARFTAVIVRHFGVERAEETAALVMSNSSPRLTGFGMAGAEQFGRPKDFTRAFSIAREAGFGLTCHAGEWCAAEAIEETIGTLQVTRLGHGVRAYESPDLMAKIRDLDIHLEVCPGSNVALGVSSDWASHPVRALYEEGISLSISSDDPPYFHTTMTREYEEMAALGWGEAEFSNINQQAMRHAFCDDETRLRLLKNWS